MPDRENHVPQPAAVVPPAPGPVSPSGPVFFRAPARHERPGSGACVRWADPSEAPDDDDRGRRTT